MSVEFKYFTFPKILASLVIALAALLGLILSGFTPLNNALHLRTTIPYYQTVTRTTTIVNYTTLMINNTVVVTRITTTTAIVYNTSIITLPTTVTYNTTATVTLNHATTVTSTTTATIVVTNTVVQTTTVVPSLTGVNFTEAVYNVTYFINAFTQFTSQLTSLKLVWLKPTTQFACYATGFRLANGSSGLILILVGNTTSIVSYPFANFTFPYGVERGSVLWGVLGVNTTSFNQASAYLSAGTFDVYTVGNVTIAGAVGGGGIAWYVGHVPFPFNLPNGTYFAWLINGNDTQVIYPCILQVINSNSWQALERQTYLGAQYWAWVRSIIQYGKPAPCYVPFEWTIGWFTSNINVTQPIGENWQYYCGVNGTWRGLKP